MQTHIQKWGNSLGLRIPIQYLRQLHLENGGLVDVSLEDEHIVIKPRRDNLELLLSQITPENLHGEVLEEDEPKGKEIW